MVLCVGHSPGFCSGGKLGSGEWVTRQHWKGVTGGEFLIAEQGVSDGCWHCGVDFPDYPGGEYGLCHRQRCTSAQSAETLGRTRAMHIGVTLEEPSISDCEMVSDGDDERYNTVGLHLAARAVVQQKVKCEQPMAQGGHPQGAPKATEFTMYRPYTQEELVNSGKKFQQMHREPSAARLL